MDCRVQNADVGRLYQSLADTEADTAVSMILTVRDETCDIRLSLLLRETQAGPGGARIDAEHVRRITSGSRTQQQSCPGVIDKPCC